MPAEHVGRLAQLRRYPVKSVLGERLGSVRVEPRGLAGDRRWAVRTADGRFGSGKTTRRFARIDGLLGLRARYDGDVPVLTLPGGGECRGDDPRVHAVLSDLLGQPVTLAVEGEVAHFDEGPVHLLSTASLTHLEAAVGRSVDPRRFRANLLVDTGGAAGLVEDGWVGRELGVGAEVVLRVAWPMSRCVMVEHAQDDLPRARGLLAAIGAVNDLCLGVLAHVVRGGRVEVGDPVLL